MPVLEVVVGGELSVVVNVEKLEEDVELVLDIVVESVFNFRFLYYGTKYILVVNPFGYKI